MPRQERTTDEPEHRVEHDEANRVDRNRTERVSGHEQILIQGNRHKNVQVNFDQRKFRDSVGLVIPVNEKEERIIENELIARVKAQEPYSFFTNSCSSNVADLLELIGILAHDPRDLALDSMSTNLVSPKEIYSILSHSKRVARKKWYPKFVELEL